MRTSGRERRPARVRAAVLALAAVLGAGAAAGCGSTGSPSATPTGPDNGSVPGSMPAATGVPGTTTTVVPPPRPTPEHPVRVETVGHVLGEPGQPLQICSVISFSTPPMCAGPIGLDAADADVPGLAPIGPTAAIGTPPPSTVPTAPGSFRRATPDRVHVVGDFDGATLTPTEPITAWDDQAPHADPPAEPIPCPEPEGGWGKVGDDHPFPGSVAGGGATRDDVQALVSDDPDFGGIWMSAAVRTDTGWDTSGQIPIVAFTGDLTRHEAEIRTIYDGPLCVTSVRFTAAALNAAGMAMSQDRERMAAEGIAFLSNGTDTSRNLVSVQVVLADQETVAWFTSQHPEGMIEVWGWLQPVAGA